MVLESTAGNIPVLAYLVPYSIIPHLYPTINESILIVMLLPYFLYDVNVALRVAPGGKVPGFVYFVPNPVEVHL